MPLACQSMRMKSYKYAKSLSRRLSGQRFRLFAFPRLFSDRDFRSILKNKRAPPSMWTMAFSTIIVQMVSSYSAMVSGSFLNV